MARLPGMNRRQFLHRSGVAVSLGLMSRGVLLGQGAPPAGGAPVRPPAPAVEFKELRRGVGYFTGRGGTIGWLATKEALVAVDTQFTETAELFLAGLPRREGRMLDAVIDTHHHWDHSGGNAAFRPATKKLVGHANVPGLQDAAFQRDPQRGPPVHPDTLFDTSWRLDFGDETVTARHFGAAHTGGDAVIHFEEANVVHLGDLVFNRIYPVTDAPGGCSLRGWIQVLDRIRERYPRDAIYIYGHGKASQGVVGPVQVLQGQRDFLEGLLRHVEGEMAAGRTRAEIVQLQNLPGFDEWHVAQNSRLPGNLGVAYDELTRELTKG